jgi:DNA processing protein
MLGIAMAGPVGPPRGAVALELPLDATPASHVDRAEREAWAILASVSKVGPATLAQLVGRFGEARRVVELAVLGGRRALLEACRDGDGTNAEPLIDELVAAAIEQRARAPEIALEPLERLGLRILLLSDPEYPPRLLSIELPPPVLFVRGAVAALDPATPIAVVGTRGPTEAGRALAIRLATALSMGGATIVSGLAIGVDGAAHAAAVELGRPTIAVLGSGHDRLYPRAHRTLADAIVADGGAVVAELAPAEEPTRWSFPRRNRLISGLSDATVVVEAPTKSGALDTAQWALEQGRALFVVPGRIGDGTSAGCLGLLRDNPGQARVVASIETLLEDVGLAGEARPTTGRRVRRGPVNLAALGLSSVEARLAERLRTDAATVDELVRETGLPVATVLGGLTLLEMRGLVVAAYGRYRPSVSLAGSSAGRAKAAAGGRRPRLG